MPLPFAQRELGYAPADPRDCIKEKMGMNNGWIDGIINCASKHLANDEAQWRERHDLGSMRGVN